MRLQLYYPTNPFFINQGFGVCGSPQLCEAYKKLGLKAHNGIDFNAGHGQFVYAAHDGEVVFAGEDGSNGQLVVIRTLEQFDHVNGKPSFYKTLYGHLQKGSFRVKPGDRAKAGQFIAQAGSTGMSTGPHVHFGLKPVYSGEKDWEWFNLNQDNGFNGAIDPSEFFVGQAPVRLASDFIARAGAKHAGYLELKKAQQYFALALVVANFGA